MLGEVDRSPRLETILPQHTRLDVYCDLAATVDAMEKADLCAQVRGVVQKVPAEVDIGRAVKKDDVLITLFIPDLVADKQHKVVLREQAEALKKQAERNRDVTEAEVVEARAQEQRFQADLQFRDLQHKRLTELAKRETIQPQLTEESRQQRDSAEAALNAARAQILTKKSRLLAAETEIEVAVSRVKTAQADVDRVSAMIEFATIRAPFDGVITKRWVDSGATVKDPGMPLLTVMRTDVVRVILDVPEREVSYVNALGSLNPKLAANVVTVRIPALQDAAFEGRVTILTGVLDPVTRTMRTEVHLENKDGRLRPQMTGSARLTLARRDRVLTVPSSALIRAGNKMEVYYVDNIQGNPPRGVVKRAVVELGLDDGRRVEIKHGLTGQERVVAKGTGVVRVGETVIAADAPAAELR